MEAIGNRGIQMKRIKSLGEIINQERESFMASEWLIFTRVRH